MKIPNSIPLIALISVIFAAGCVSQVTGAGEGRTVFTMADTSADIDSVSSIKMTVQNVRVHSAANGWTTVSSSAKTFDLLQLKAQGNQALLADARLDAGSYDKVQLDISNVVVTDARGQQQTKLPSGEFTVAADLIVVANQTSTAAFDFIADESLHVTSQNEFVMAPVAEVETRENASVDTRSANNVAISGGTVTTDIKVGMDINGNVGIGLSIPATAVLSIGTGGNIIIGATGQGRAVLAISDAAANMSSVSSVKVTVESVRVHSAGQGWVTVSSSAKTYDLLQLDASGNNALLADANLTADTYTQLRLDISNVLVTNASGTHEAKLPSGELRLAGQLVVKANETATANFDFIVNESLHVTGDGKFILAPVIQLETRENANVNVISSSNVAISGGLVRTNAKFGMDASGNVGEGLRIAPGASLTVGAGGSVQVQ